jgi:DNA-binding NtrC family response regulator
VKPRLLLFEPDARLRADLGAYLERAGYAVSAIARFGHSAESRPGAVAAIARVGTETPLARVGDFARAIAPAPLVAIDDALTPARALALRAHGAAASLRAPFGANALLDALAALLRARSHLVRGPETRSPRMRALLQHADALARGRGALLLVGEHGSGRRWLARRIHAHSACAAGPLVEVDASDLDAGAAAPLRDASSPAPAIAGPDAGALRAAWNSARGGSLALANPGELAPQLQRELVALLESPHGADAPRLVACARGDRARVAAALVPELWLRLSGAVLEVPPLRERLEDLPALAAHFLARAAAERGLARPELDAGALAALAAYPFRGNLAELANLMQRAVIAGSSARLDVAALLDPRARRAPASSHATLDLETLERDAIERALAAANGNRTHASRALGISVRTLRNKLHRYGLAAS